MFYAGIDPGANGAMCVVNMKGRLVNAFRFKDKTNAEICANFYWFKKLTKKDDTSFTMLEIVHAFPGAGVSGMFKFGRGYGVLEGMLESFKIPFAYVLPQKWQKDMDCLTKGDKNITKALAQKLFPKVKVTHGISDSLIMAEYCRRARIR